MKLLFGQDFPNSPPKGVAFLTSVPVPAVCPDYVVRCCGLQGLDSQLVQAASVRPGCSTVNSVASQSVALLQLGAVSAEQTCDGRVYQDVCGRLVCTPSPHCTRLGCCPRCSSLPPGINMFCACRLLPHQDLPSQRVQGWRDLRQCVETGLEARPGAEAHPGYHQVSTSGLISHPWDLRWGGAVPHVAAC